MADQVKILIVDDHPFFRQGVSFFLNSIKDLHLVGGVSSGEVALEMIAANQVDVVLMDLEMPGMDGITATQTLLESFPQLRVLILTSFGSEAKIHQALKAGAAGYCLKDAEPKELLTAIHAVAEGGTYLGKGITPKVFTETYEEQQSLDTHKNILFQELTQREIDVLKHLTQGLSNKEIAHVLIVSEKTVKTHVANILHKLDVKTRTQAALLASKQRFFQEE